MRIIHLADGHTCSIYQSIFELPADRHTELNCYLLQLSGVGTDVESVNRHFAALSGFIANNQRSEAADELAQLHYNFHWGLDKFAPGTLAFACLVASVDGQACQDFTEAGLTTLSQRLSALGLTAGLVTAEVEEVKKNFRPN